MQLTCGNRSDNHPTAPRCELCRRSRTWPPHRPGDVAGWSPRRYSVSLRVTSTPPTSREVRLYTTAPIVDMAVISTMLSEPSRAVYPSTLEAENQALAFTPVEP